MLNFTNLKLKKIKLEKLGALAIFTLFTIASFLTGSSVSNAAASGTALPISFGGTGATTQSAALTNLGINNTLDENSSNSTFPSAKTVYNYMNGAMNKGYISMDNINFSDSITNWTGGDLIYKGSDLSSTASNNKIKVGDKTCVTSYKNNSAANDNIPQAGCVLPNLAEGTHAVTISTDGGTSYTINAGKVIYAQTPNLPNCDTTSMQTFGANAAACKAAMAQGQVIVLNDPRGNSDNPNGQKYRVKKLPGGSVWMIDDYKLGYTNKTMTLTSNNTNINSSSCVLPSVTADTWHMSTDYNYGSISGYAYNLDTVHIYSCGSNYNNNIGPKGWGLANGSNSQDSNDTFIVLNNTFFTESSQNNNPVYYSGNIYISYNFLRVLSFSSRKYWYGNKIETLKGYVISCYSSECNYSGKNYNGGSNISEEYAIRFGI
ncbi:MAG: IPT/TIG domain-containing protein [Bifidobacteriaceae bacterium]|jgi:hypothetical protein|nr:IPT/TIG domain-containing protein [Bifidobacteriaceae bacterium]